MTFEAAKTKLPVMTFDPVTEAKARAAVHRATLTDEQRAAGDALAASAADRFRRMFIFPPNEKGNQASVVLTEEEFQEFLDMRAREAHT